jgi:hypothetical protein
MAETASVGVAVAGALQALRMSAASEITGSKLFRYFFMVIPFFKHNPTYLDRQAFHHNG